MTALVAVETAAEPAAVRPHLAMKASQRIALRPAGSLFSPQESFAWIIGVLAVGACIVPWITRGWLWFGLIAATVALLACYDAFALWLTDEECVPVLLREEKGLRGHEGQTIEIPFALTGSFRRWRHDDIRAGVMAANARKRRRLPHKNLPPDPEARAARDSRRRIELREGRADPALAMDSGNHFASARAHGLGRELASSGSRAYESGACGRWFDMPEPLRIDADLRSGRQEILRSPVYRMLVASRADAMDRARTRIRALAGISARRQLLGDRLEVNGATGRSSHAALPMGAKTGSVFRRGSVAGIRPCPS